jgi:hypothetical protein
MKITKFAALAVIGLLACGFIRGGPIPTTAGGGGGGACAAGLVDTVAASPGSYTFGISFRKIRAAFAGSAVELQRTSDNATQNTGFLGCDFDTTSAASFCGTASLAISTTSARVALPAGTSVFVYNSDVNGAAAYVNLGNSTVTATVGSGTKIPAQAGLWVTTSSNTFLAGIVYQINNLTGVGGSNTIKISNCGVRSWYDQISTNNAIQTTQANQFGYFPDVSNSKPGAVCGSNLSAGTTLMTVPDSATYKTGVVHSFQTGTVSWSTYTNSTQKSFVNYPDAAGSNAYNVRWGLAFGPNGDQVNFGSNNSPFVGNIEGFGEGFRTIPATYDVSTANATVRRNSTQFFTGGSNATVTYPTAVGLVIGGAASGAGCGNMVINEVLLASATQTTPANVVSNTTTYWGITNPATTASTADGFTYNVDLWGSYGPSPPGPGPYSINGNLYASEGTWNQRSIWQANNVKTAGTTSLGDMWRFEIKSSDEAWINITGMRQELDGAAGLNMNLDQIYFVSYAFQLESGSGTATHGTVFPGAQWNITGQAHGTTPGAKRVAAPFYFEVMDNQLVVIQDNIAVPGCTPDINCQTVVFTSASNFVQPGTWIQVFVKVRKSTSGTTDIFQAYIGTAGVTPTPQVVNCTGACFWTDTGKLYWKVGLYRGPFEPVNDVPWTEAWRYGNLQVTATDISAQITTPLDPPVHQ